MHFSQPHSSRVSWTTNKELQYNCISSSVLDTVSPLMQDYLRSCPSRQKKQESTLISSVSFIINGNKINKHNSFIRCNHNRNFQFPTPKPHMLLAEKDLLTWTLVMKPILSENCNVLRSIVNGFQIIDKCSALLGFVFDM